MLDEKEITNLNSLKLNVKKIWRELDSDKAFCVEKLLSQQNALLLLAH